MINLFLKKPSHTTLFSIGWVSRVSLCVMATYFKTRQWKEIA
jgi:hypothetical protein